jgi:hypothetical protein
MGMGAAPASCVNVANSIRKSPIPIDVDVFDSTEHLVGRPGGMSLFSIREPLAPKQSTRWNVRTASRVATGINGLRSAQPPKYPEAQITSPNRRFCGWSIPQVVRVATASHSLAAANTVSFPAGRAPVSGPRRLISRLTCYCTRVRRQLKFHHPQSATALARRLAGSKQIIFIP